MDVGRSRIFMVAFMLVSILGLAHSPFGQAEIQGVGKRVKMPLEDKSGQYLAQIEALPEVEVESQWALAPAKFKTELTKKLQAKKLNPLSPFRSTVWLNQPSPITREAKYFVHVVSLSMGKSVRFDGDFLFFIKSGKKKFSDSEMQFLKEIFP